MKFFGAVLRGRREFLKLTPVQVGQAVGVSGGTINAIERGQMPQMANFLRLSKWMGIAPATFLSADDIDLLPIEPEHPVSDDADGPNSPVSALETAEEFA